MANIDSELEPALTLLLPIRFLKSQVELAFSG